MTELVGARERICIGSTYCGAISARRVSVPPGDTVVEGAAVWLAKGGTN
jgi:hypothetical protein